MQSPSPSSKFSFAVALSFSFTLSSSSLFHLPIVTKFPPNLSLKLFSIRSRHSLPSDSQNIATDLLYLLGSTRDVGRVPDDEARQLRSCLRFMVPPFPTSSMGRKRISDGTRGRVLEKEDEMVWWPPTTIMELARLAVDSGGNAGIIQRALNPTILPVPDIQGLKKDKCQLTRTLNGHRFVNNVVNSYFEFLFELIVERAHYLGLNVSLNRYDFFHGHLFLANDSGRLGILFHAREYPAYEKEKFPYNLGFCQTGSKVIYDDSMNLRNILWLAPLPSIVTKSWLAPGTLVVLDAHPEGIIYQKLVPEYVGIARTIYEDDFGEVVVDVNYLNVDNAAPGERIFIC